MVKIFTKRIDMIESVKESDRDSKMFCQYPVSVNGACKFVIFNKDKKFFSTIDSFTNKDILHEIFLDGTMRKPYLDIEHIYESVEEFRKDSNKFIRQLIDDIIKVFDIAYNKNISHSDILFLNSTGEIDNKIKLSIHVIISPKDITYYYLNSKPNTNNSAYHLYSCLINLNHDYKDYIDGQVYKTNPSLRMIGSDKFPRVERILKPLDNKTLKILEPSNRDKLRYLISYIDTTKPIFLLETPIIEQVTVKKSAIIYDNPTRTDCHNELEKKVKKYHPTAKLRRYANGFYDFNYTDRNEPCPVTGSLHPGNAGFYCFETNTGIYLKCRSNKCNENKIHIGYFDDSDEFIDNAHQMNQKYLLENPDMISIIEKWMSDNKTLCIKSAMGTGKTTLIKHLLEKYNYKKILWITHRQTLTKSLYGSFKKYGFVSYMDTNGNLFKENKVIVQVDSLKKIYFENPFEMTIDYNKYDLVIIDEIEGCLSHFNSPFLNKIESNARDIFDSMIEAISGSKKLLLLDADIGVRTMLFSEHFGKVITVNNTYQPIKKIFTATNDDYKFKTELFSDINSGKKVCIVSMSSKCLEVITHELDNKNIKYVMHIAKSDDKLKDELEDVNSFWKKYQVVLYSPTITSGVDFNEKHFDKIYCIIKSGNKVCDQRSFLQMVGRIRHINNQEILCWYTDIPFIRDKNELTPKLLSPMYTYNDLLSYYRYFETFKNVKLLYNVTYEIIDDGKVIKKKRNKIDITLYDKINLHNEVENLNKHRDIFLTVLNRLITKAGHELRIDLIDKSKNKTNKKEKNEEDDEIKFSPKKAEINQIINLDESKYNMNELVSKQSANKLNETEKLVLKKHFFKKDLGIKNGISDEKMVELLDKFIDDRTPIFRYEKLFGYSNFELKDNVLNNKEKVKTAIIIDLVNRLLETNYKSLKESYFETDEEYYVTITDKQYNTRLDDIIENSLYFKNEENNRALFFDKPGKLIKNDDKMAYCRKIQVLLESYNINLRVLSRYKKNGKFHYIRSLSVDEQIRDIVTKKYTPNIKKKTNN